MLQLKSASVPNIKIERLIEETMKPFFEDTAGFEECYKKLDGKLLLYLQE